MTDTPLYLGKHFIALNVKNIEVSQLFYSKLGFLCDPRFSDIRRNWIIMKNVDITIGLYQDVIPQNTITFNPENIRELQKHLKNQGVKFILEADETTTGPAHFLIVDPDGNPLFFDQN